MFCCFQKLSRTLFFSSLYCSRSRFPRVAQRSLEISLPPTGNVTLSPTNTPASSPSPIARKKFPSFLRFLHPQARRSEIPRLQRRRPRLRPTRRRNSRRQLAKVPLTTGMTVLDARHARVLFRCSSTTAPRRHPSGESEFSVTSTPAFPSRCETGRAPLPASCSLRRQRPPLAHRSRDRANVQLNHGISPIALPSKAHGNRSHACPRPGRHYLVGTAKSLLP